VEDGRNGRLVEIDDPRAMSAAVLELLRDPEMARRMIAEGRRDCDERYSWPAARRGWRQVYARLARHALPEARPVAMEVDLP
jgi:glycosyltransferase involved in cell wall biosynthesis